MLKHNKKFYTKRCPIDFCEFVSECIHYNINIIRDKRVILIKELIDSGHLVNNE